jgi:DNA-binding MurR/RpiR family transcriptional regulator
VTQAHTVKDLIHEHGGTLTPAERKLSETLLRNYPVSGLQSVTRLAEAAGVSTPTVIRMARKLGFDGFPEFQDALRDEAAMRIMAPERHPPPGRQSEGESGFQAFVRAAIENIAETVERLPTETFEAIAAILGDLDRAIYLSGGRITRSNADYFFNHLQIIRPAVTLLSQSPNVWPQYILDMNPNSVLVVFDIRRYEADLTRLATLAKERGATIILFTDQWGSPVPADHVVKARVEVPSSWDSTLAINLVVEALIAEVQARLRDQAQDRIDVLEEMFNTTRIFRKAP